MCAAGERSEARVHSLPRLQANSDSEAVAWRKYPHEHPLHRDPRADAYVSSDAGVFYRTANEVRLCSEETVSTLKFGQLCKTIKNNVKNNEVVDDRALLKMYKNMVAELRQQLLEAETRGRTASVVRILDGEDGDAEDGIAEVDGQEDDRGSRVLRAEMAKLRKENAELRAQANVLQASAKEISDIESQKNAFEEYQRESQAAIDDERVKMESEKEVLAAERARILAEKTHLDEKVSARALMRPFSSLNGRTAAGGSTGNSARHVG
jgi:hypothetical protein